jgi:hypothetical protein
MAPYVLKYSRYIFQSIIIVSYVIFAPNEHYDLYTPFNLGKFRLDSVCIKHVVLV